MNVCRDDRRSFFVCKELSVCGMRAGIFLQHDEKIPHTYGSREIASHEQGEASPGAVG